MERRMNLSAQTLWALVAVVMMALAVSGQNDCKGSVGGSAYDISGLASALGNKEVQTTDNTGQVYFYKPCGIVENLQCQTATDTKPAVCQRDLRNPPMFHDLGSQATATFTALPANIGTEGFTLGVTGGEDARQTQIYFKCDKGANPGTFTFLSEPVAKTYQFQYTTKFACIGGGGGGGDGGGGGGDDDGISGGWIFIIILSSLLVLYLIGGVVYNKFVAHKEGKELIPNVEFWTALPGYVKDGHLFVWRKLRSLTGRGSYEEM
jgi:hypothetical protein